MGLGPRLDLRQSQQLVMTPQLQQAIKLLALSNLEIEGFIAEEVEKNPLLEIGGDDSGDREVAAAEADAPMADGPAEADAIDGDGASLDIDPANENLHQDSASDSMADRAGGMDGGLGVDGLASPSGEAPDLDAIAGAGVSLHDHLLAQAGEVMSGAELFVAGHLIDQIDEAGYLGTTTLEVAQRLGAPLALVEQVLATVQTFDPTGVGARSLAECIAIQAREADRYDPCMQRLIANLDLLARGNLAQLKRLCGVDDEDLGDMIRELRNYDPKPGLKIGGESAPPVVPDLFVARTRKGWAIELNQATLPKVLINRSYYVELSSGPQDKASRAWLADCMTSANWLMKALDQRARTIIKVATELVKQQEGFFLHGVEQLKPLTLRAVAEAIGMHESTVSRVTSNKYLACERGLFELKFFFTSGVATADGGDAASSEAVKSHIARLIADEPPDGILSDDALVDLLKERGFDIARRTVAKYREAIGLGSSVQRRRQKAIRGQRAA